SSEKISIIWDTAQHLNDVIAKKEVRDAYEKCVPAVTKHFAEIEQDVRIYQVIEQISKSKEYESLNPTQKKIISDKLRDFQLAGVALSPEKKERFVHLKQRLEELSNSFSNNVLGATQSYSLNITDKEVKGLPESSILLGRENAKKKNQDGLVFTLDLPSYISLVTYADSRDLREKICTAFLTRASDKAADKKWDNSKIIEEILQIRKELASLLSFKNFAEYSVADKMTKKTEVVTDFLYDLAKKYRPKAEEEIKELQEIAAADGVNKLEQWDVGISGRYSSYYAEKLKEKKFAMSQEDLRAYFPAPYVLDGVFNIIQKLYGVTFKENKDIPVWHEDVKFFEVYDHENNLQGYIYLDLYYRDHKTGGAWMNDGSSKRYITKDGVVKLPATYLVCNFSPPINGRPSLLTHKEVLTLLHEIGHCLQHLLTKVDYLAASGTNGVPRDAVEVASQFMENWGWQEESLNLLSRHYLTGEPMPKEMLKKLLDTRTFQVGRNGLRQIEYALIDFMLHLQQTATKDEIEKVIADVRKQTRVIPAFKDEMILHSFLHLFGHGYEAGYYGYLWSHVISSDLFSKFEEQGIFNQEIGRDFLRKFLEAGNSEEPEVLFKRFLGRDVKPDAFLRHYGISKNESDLCHILSPNLSKIYQRFLLDQDYSYECI
ncbi:MAG: M3 family metallopeptidase, partial [Gammaproteobacteria bacterium]|nr:M3 family metallopeptidase [Gammaproteobacteria bacterium]